MVPCLTQRLTDGQKAFFDAMRITTLSRRLPLIPQATICVWSTPPLLTAPIALPLTMIAVKSGGCGLRAGIVIEMMSVVPVQAHLPWYLR